jgi:hypothetical protein
MGRSHGRYESNGRTLGSTTRWPLAVESSLRSPAERYLRISSYHSPTIADPYSGLQLHTYYLLRRTVAKIKVSGAGMGGYGPQHTLIFRNGS